MIGTAHPLSHLLSYLPHECVQGTDHRRWLAASGDAIVAAQAQASGCGNASDYVIASASYDTGAGAGAQSAAVVAVRGRLATEHFKWISGGGTGHRAPLRDIHAYPDGMAAYTALAAALQGRVAAHYERTQ